MAFCTKCGKELTENEVCSCQQEAPVEAPKAETPQSTEAPKAESSKAEVPQPEVTSQPEAKKQPNKMLVPAVIGVVVILLIVLIASLAGGKPYKKMLDEYVSLVNKKSTDVDAYDYALMAEGRVKFAKEMQKTMLKIDEDSKDLLEEEKEEKADAYEECNDEFEGWKLSYEIKSADKMSEKDLKSYQKDAKSYYKDYIKPVIKNMEEILENDDDEIEEGADELDISEKEYKSLVKTTLKQYKDFEDMEITKGYEVKVKFTVKTKDDEYKADTVKVVVLKVNGDWVYAGRAEGEDKRISFEESRLNFLVSPLNKSYMYE